jgi:hypothetical protein
MSRLRQLQNEGRLDIPERPLRREHTEPPLAKPRSGHRERRFPKQEQADVDTDVMAAAEHFLERSKRAGTLQTGSAFALHRVFLDRVEVSGVRRMVNHHNGKPMWPDILVTLVDVYWDTEANPRNEWAWKHFVTGAVFDRLVAYLCSRIEEAYDRAADTRTVEDKQAARQANWDRIAERAKLFTPTRPSQEQDTSAEVPRRSDADVFEDDLEEWEALMAKKRAARSKEGS